MKKILFAALAATILLASCGKEDNESTGAEATQVTVKISGVIKSTGTRTVEAPGIISAGTIQLSGGHIFVINPLGAVIHNEDLNVSTARDAGQVLNAEVPADSRVYIVGNYAEGFTPATLSTIDAIKAATSAMTTQTDYKGAALANAGGQPAAIVPGATEATVNVSISPLISRLELVQIQGGANDDGDAITDFTVTGVYVDDYHSSFTYGGGNSGTMFEQGASTTFNGIGDAGTWNAAGNPLAAAPAGGNVWAHNVAPGGVPRLIIKLENVKYLPAAGEEVDLGTTPYYLTVTGYTGVTAFERGKIYRIGSAANAFSFTPDDLALTPNPEDTQLRVNVTIVEWEIVTPTAVL